jgi:lipoyl(octanoyl) transferase
MSQEMPRIEVIRIPEPVAYNAMLERQKARREKVEMGEAPDTLFLLEHEPVITLGRNAKPEHVLLSPEELQRRGITLVESDRGGDVTVHGPGQLVAYPILNLASWRRSVNGYLRQLEESVIRTLAHYGLAGERMPPYTGVWVNGAKICAIGIGIHRWITFHGIALNICPDMELFNTIVPCGIADRPVTSMHCLRDNPPLLPEVMDCFEEAFCESFEAHSRRP